MDISRSDCPCPPGTCANMTSDKFRCKATTPAAMPAQACEVGCLDIDNEAVNAEAVEYVTNLTKALLRIAADYGCAVSVQNKMRTGADFKVTYEPVIDVQVMK